MTIDRYILIHGANNTNASRLITFLPAGTEVVIAKDHEHALAEKDRELNEQIIYANKQVDELIKFRTELSKRNLELMQARQRVDQQARELERLTAERDKYKMEALVKFNCEVCSGSLEDENARLIKQRDDLLRTAVKFGLIIRKGRWGIPEADDVERFLATPAATALQQAKGE